jgi:hypothetical protein
MTTPTVCTLPQAFERLEQWVDIIMSTFSPMEKRIFHIDRESVIQLLIYAYDHDQFRNIILTPWTFKPNYKELYHAYLQQWEK